MRHFQSDPELLDLVRRFVTPDRRYLRLGGGLLRLSPVKRSAFVRDLAQAAYEITPAELGILFHRSGGRTDHADTEPDGVRNTALGRPAAVLAPCPCPPVLLQRSLVHRPDGPDPRSPGPVELVGG